ncbi:MAG: S-layer homology domain-containing protein [Oscillospiraceae bacterium]|nr:S-layer homology domain-containing protein [Oscillospiraceae bacterium]
MAAGATSTAGAISSTPEQDFHYAIYDEDDEAASLGAGAYITRYTGAGSTVVVPATLGGADVVSIELAHLPQYDPDTDEEIEDGYIKLTTLDVSACTALKYLNCDGNSLTTLDVSKNVLLTGLSCGRNSLTTLDVSSNTALVWINCESNNLKKLDVTKNTLLTKLYCAFNKLTALDVSKNIKLWYLDCGYQYIASLDVSKNTALVTLRCAYNYLTVLDISENKELRAFYCGWNYFASKESIIGLDEESLSIFQYIKQREGLPPIGTFTDAFITEWYAPYVAWASENSVVTGYPDSTFRPNNTMTRAEFVQVLYSLAGKPAVTATTAFTDVAADDWYVKAVSWAVKSGITSGIGNGEFAPGGSVTREQAVAFLYKYAKMKGDNADYSGVALTFYDKADISGWAIPAVKWSAANKVVGGYPDGTFGPQNTATRAEVVTILYGYIN